MDIYLHLGAHHTAGAAFMQACDENLHHFDQPKMAIWGRQDARLVNLLKIARDPSANVAKSKDVAARALKLGRVHVREAVNDGVTGIILDAANILGTRQDNLRHHRLYPRAKDRLARLLPVFDGCRVHLHFATRTYEAYWSSVLFEAVSHGVSQPDDAVLDYLVTQPMRWRHLVETLADVSPVQDVHVWTFEAFGNRPTDLIASLYCAKTNPVDFASPSKELADALRADPTWNVFEPHHVATLRGQYKDDIDWLESGQADGLVYHAPKRHDRPVHADPKRPTVITPRRVASSRGTADDREKRPMG